MASGAEERTVIFRRALTQEPFESLVPLMGHELLHDDAANDLWEETVLNALTGWTWVELLARRPELAFPDTIATRAANGSAAMVLNGHARDDPTPAIVVPDGRVLPGSATNAADAHEWVTLTYGGWIRESDTGAPVTPLVRGSLEGLLDLTALPSEVGALGFREVAERWPELWTDERAGPVDRLRVSVLLGLRSIPRDRRHHRAGPSDGRGHVRPHPHRRGARRGRRSRSAGRSRRRLLRCPC